MNIYKRSNLAILVLYILGVAMGLFGIIIGFYYLNNKMARSVGVLMCLIGAYVIRKAKIRSYGQYHEEINKKISKAKNSHLRPIVWVLALISFVACAVFLILMCIGTKTSYHHAWIIYAFAVSGQILLVVVVYIIGVVVRSIFRD